MGAVQKAPLAAALLTDSERPKRFALVGCEGGADRRAVAECHGASARDVTMRPQRARYWEDKDAEACESDEDESRSGSGSESEDDDDGDNARNRGATSGSVPLWPQSYR